MRRESFIGAAVLGLASVSGAQNIQVLLQAGDVVPGAGTVGAGQFGDPMVFIQVNDSGTWMIQFEYDDSDQDAVLRDGVIVRQSGGTEPSGTIPGATISTANNSIVAWRLYNSGAVTWSLNLDGTPLGVDDNNAMYVDNTLVARENDTPPAAGWGAGTAFTVFEEPYLTDVGTMIVRGRNDDPTTAAVSDWFISEFTLNAMNQITGETIIARTGDILPGLTTGAFPINTIRSGFHNGTANGNGDAIFGADLLEMPTGVPDSVVYRWDANTQMLTKIAEEGEIEPLTGQPFGSIISPEFHLTDTGVLTWKDQVASPTSDFIISDGALFRFENDTHPAFPGEDIDSFSNGYSKRLDDGRVFWVGDFSGTSSADNGLFIEDTLLVQEGVTMVNGQVIDEVTAQSEDQFISDNGRWLIFRGELNNVDTVFLMDLMENIAPFCNGDGGDQMGCTPCPCGNEAPQGTSGGCINSAVQSARLDGSGSASVAAGDLRFEMEGGNLSTFGVLVSAANQLPQMGLCPVGSGILGMPPLDGLRCVGGNLIRHGSRATDANGDIGITNNGWGPPNGPMGGIANQGGFVAGQERNFQVFYREEGTLICQSGQNTSNAVSVLFQM